MSQIIKQIKPIFEEKAIPIVKVLNRINISPNIVTIVGLLLVSFGAYFIYVQTFIIATFFLLIGNLCDAIDGLLARKYGKVSKFGAFLDSLTDRISDVLPLIAIAVLFKDNLIFLIISLISVIASFLVSYARARAEGLNIDCKVGILERPERSIILIISVLFHHPEVAVILISIGSIITVIQRINCVYKKSTNSR